MKEKLFILAFANADGSNSLKPVTAGQMIMDTEE